MTQEDEAVIAYLLRAIAPRKDTVNGVRVIAHARAKAAGLTHEQAVEQAEAAGERAKELYGPPRGRRQAKRPPTLVVRYPLSPAERAFVNACDVEDPEGGAS